ncbi:hypothetical protein QYF36_024837 [Acer negundo]|nr:hypothetical protein QYF36_024837 [Acer negundo]
MSKTFPAKVSILRNAIQECKNMGELKQIHSQIITSPYIHKNQHHFLISRLLFFCAFSNFGSLSYATNVFRHIKEPNLYVYNIMIRAYACKFGESNDTHLYQSLKLYKRMLFSGILPDFLTFPFLLKECTRRLDGLVGSTIHGQAIKFGLYDDVFVQNSMISLYMACGLVTRAKKLFDEMFSRDVVSWNAMIIGYLRNEDLDKALDLFRRMEKRNVISWNSIITGFVQGGRAKEALEFFQEMQSSSDDDLVKPDKITIASVLSACAYLGAIDHGNWVHGYLNRSGLECDVVIGTALVDMYGKCGCVGKAYAAFKEMPEKDTLAWTAMISVFALHGYAKEAFDTFKEMEDEGVKPNHVTFVGLFSACAHSGLVGKGRWCFDLMRHVYLMEPQGNYNGNLMRDLFGDGIFAVDGDKWRHQRKLASYEFSTKVLRDFSTAVFRANAAKLTSKISEAAVGRQTIDLQAGPRICLGKEFAYRQMKMLGAVLVNFFKFRLVDETKEATYRTMFTLHMDQGLHLHPYSRL